MRIPRGLTAGIMVLAVLAAGVFVACGDDDDDDASTDTTATATEAGNANGSHATSKITIEDPWARPSTNDVSAVYMVIKNDGAEDRLVSATADVSPKVQIHEMVTEGNSQRMQEVEGGVVVPEHGSVELKPGGYHIMLMNLPEPLEAGDVVKVALSFEHAGTIDVEASVREAAQMQGQMQGGQMHGSGMHGSGMQGSGMQSQPASSSAICSPASDGITVKDQWARPSTNDVSAVFLVIENAGTEDRLISATSDVSPKVQVHEVVTNGSSMQMQEMKDGLLIPAGECVELRPGGYHIMLMQLTAPLVVGDAVQVTLTFEHAGEVEVEAIVRDPAQVQGGGMQHGGGS